ncbi:hypothetical protein, partial [Methanosarcina sp. 2.H.T.1A.15]|uniref:hypothetical protein n=1 Tax=Methanosarcina sp. 2.H.T.1A.15 TaxID=1483596 RepID=UPI000A508ED0
RDLHYPLRRQRQMCIRDRPMVALTLVEMGRELIGVQTALNLGKGLDKILISTKWNQTSLNS